MKAHLECIPCFISQSLESARMATDDEKIQTKVIKEVMKYLQNISFLESPPEISREVHQIIRKVTKSEDPYKKVKDKSNELAKKEYNHLKKLVKESDDPLLMSIKLSIVGNVIDFGTMNRFNLDDMIEVAIKKEFDKSSYYKFIKTLEKSKTILFLADNSGEIFFDKLLLEELYNIGKKIFYVVKSNPIINDATLKDAKYADIDKLATIIIGDEGYKISAPGIIMKYSSKDLLRLFKSSDMLISKGQGNYEGLSSEDREIFFMLVAKCPLVAKDINAKVGDLVLKTK